MTMTDEQIYEALREAFAERERDVDLGAVDRVVDVARSVGPRRPRYVGWLAAAAVATVVAGGTWVTHGGEPTAVRPGGPTASTGASESSAGDPAAALSRAEVAAQQEQHRAVTADAVHRAVAEVALPPGAVKAAGPRDDLLEPVGTWPPDAVVDVTYWHVDASPGQVVATVASREPSGLSDSGSGTGPHGLQMRYFSMSSLGTAQTALLSVNVSAVADRGGSFVRIYAAGTPRPVRDPASYLDGSLLSVHVDVVRGVAGSGYPGRERVVSADLSGAQARTFAAAYNHLWQRSPSLVVSCPAALSRTLDVLTFATTEGPHKVTVDLACIGAVGPGWVEPSVVLEGARELDGLVQDAIRDVPTTTATQAAPSP